jgi:DNA primase
MQKTQVEFARGTTLLSRLIGQRVKLRRSSGGFIGLCPFHHEKTPSFHVSDARGTYKCYGCGAWGDHFDWLMQTKGVTFIEAVTELSGGYVETAKPFPDKIHVLHNTGREDDDRRIKHAHDLWLKREPIAGTVAERYLVTTRGIKGPISSTLGHVPNAYCSVLGEETNALIAPLQDSRGHVTAVQQIFLSRETDDAWRDERGRRVKRTLGAMRDGAVRLGLPDRVLGLAGSVEDALAASWLYSLPVWATCGEHRMARVWIPEEINHLIIFADADEPGIKAAQEAKKAHQRGRQVSVQYPTGKDFCDVTEARI